MITPMQNRFILLLSRRNHMSTAKTLQIDICRANEVHFPDQIVRYRLHYDVMRARRPAQYPVLTAQHRAVRFICVRQHQNWQSRHWGQYSSQMRADSLNQLMIDVLWCGYPREEVTQTVSL